MKCKSIAAGLALIAEKNKKDVKTLLRISRKGFVKLRVVQGSDMTTDQAKSPEISLLLGSRKIPFTNQITEDSIYDSDADADAIAWRFSEIEKKFKKEFGKVRMSGGKKTEQNILAFIKKLL